MQNKFKVGDKVCRTTCDCDYKHGEEILYVGETGTVSAVGSGGWLDIDNRNGSPGFNPEYFELVSPEPSMQDRMLAVIDEQIECMQAQQSVGAFTLEPLSEDQLKLVRMFVNSFVA